MNKAKNKMKKWLVAMFITLLPILFIIVILLSIVGVFIPSQKKELDKQESCETAPNTVTNVETSKDMQKNAETIYKKLVGEKIATKEGACALLGVWQYESRLDPTIVNSSSGATGLAQWLGSRLVELKSFADKRNKKYTDLGVQIDFFLKEANSSYYKNLGTIDALKGNDVHKSVKKLVLGFEGLSQNPEQWFLESNGQGGAGRYAMADQWYSKFADSNKLNKKIVEQTTKGDEVPTDISCSDSSDNSVSDDWRDKIIEVAKTQKNTKYFMGNPQEWNKKLDCSGLVQGTYDRAVGIKLGRNTIAQEHDFREISKDKAQKGDVCFWGTKGATDHIAIYDGEDGVYEMKDENLNFKHSSLKGYSLGKPTYYATIEGTKLGKKLENYGGTSSSGKWQYPSPNHGSFSPDQDFGPRNYAPSPWHDGLDFGSASWTSNKILACHGGKVIFAGDPGTKGIDNSYPNGLGKAVIVIRSGDLNVVYQEFSTTTSAIKVKVGDTVKTGQLIGIRNTAHLHLGITKSDWVKAQAKYLTDDGTWLDPKKIIEKGMS